MTELDNLKNVIASLSRNERADVLKRVRLGENEKKNISAKLLELLIEDQNFTASTLQQILYGENNIGAFKKIISRIFDKVFDVFVIRDNILLYDGYDERAKQIFLLEQQLLISEILRFRGLFNLSTEKLENVIVKCKYYEHYDILIYALEKRSKWTFHNLSDRENAKNIKEIEFYINAKNALRDSSFIFYKIFKLNYEFNFDSNKKYILECLIKLRRYYNQSNSKLIGFYILYIKIQFYNLSYQYNKAIKYIDQIIEYILDNKNIYSKLKHGNALLNKGAIGRRCFNYDMSLQCIIDSKRILQSQYQNEALIYEQFFLTYFYLGNMLKFKYYLNIINVEFINKNKKIGNVNKMQYYLAVISFISKDYKKSLSQLAQFQNVGERKILIIESKLLCILNYIELLNYDLADYSIDSLRKYVSRFPKDYNYYKYYESVSKMLGNISYNSYNFKAVLSKFDMELKSIEKVVYSDFLNENHLILFHEWFKAKANNESYDHVEVMKRLKKLHRLSR